MSAVRPRTLDECSWCMVDVEPDHQCPVMADLIEHGLIDVDATNQCVACGDNSLMGFEMANPDECKYCVAGVRT